MANDKLTAKQEAFCRNIAIKEMSQHDAYVDAFATKTERRNSVDCSAAKLANNAKITQRICQLKAQKDEKLLKAAIVTKQELIGNLLAIRDEMIAEGAVNQKANYRNTAIKAIDQVCKMMGFNEADKIALTGSVKISIDVEDDE